MTRLIAAEVRKLITTRLWLWLLLASMAWTAGFSALAIALLAVPGAVIISVALFGVTGAGPGALLSSEVTAGVRLLPPGGAAWRSPPGPRHSRRPGPS